MLTEHSSLYPTAGAGKPVVLIAEIASMHDEIVVGGGAFKRIARSIVWLAAQASFGWVVIRRHKNSAVRFGPVRRYHWCEGRP